MTTVKTGMILASIRAKYEKSYRGRSEMKSNKILIYALSLYSMAFIALMYLLLHITDKYVHIFADDFMHINNKIVITLQNAIFTTKHVIIMSI